MYLILFVVFSQRAGFGSLCSFELRRIRGCFG